MSKKPRPWDTVGAKKNWKKTSQLFFKWQPNGVECYKYLETHLESKLNFHQHIDMVKKQNFANLWSVFSIEKVSNGTAINICL